MARVRRKKTSASLRLNFEIAGIVALGLALLMGVALIVPSSRSGAVGSGTAWALHTLFGSAAWLFPALVALIGAIVFLEINVPRMIATLGTAATLYFVVVDAAYGKSGGAFGATVRGALSGLVGELGADIVLVLVALLVTVWITDVSVKKVIGWCIVRLAALRPPPRPAREERVAAKPEPGPTSLREAFHLPAVLPKPAGRRGASAATAATAAAPTTPTASAATPSVPVAQATPVADGAAKRGDRLPSVYDEHLVEEEALADDEMLYEDDDDIEGDETFLDEDDAVLEDDETDVVHAEHAADDDAPIDERFVIPAPPTPRFDASSAVEPPPFVASRPSFASTASPVVTGEYEPPSFTPQDEAQPVYRLPDLDLFDLPTVQKADDVNRAALLEDTLASFGVGAKVVHSERGPSITRYELKPERGVKISRIAALADDLALALAATSVRIEAPIPGKSAVGIEVPNATTSIVAIREILEALPQRGTIPPLNMALGKDITGRPVFGDLGKMPHLLVAGATGSGKSVCLNCIIASLLVTATPDQVQMLFIDPKRVELTVYNGIPHLIKEVITDARIAAGALFEMTKEMDQRYERFAKAGVRKIEEYNAKYPDEKLPFIVIVIDELADLMLIAPAKVETTICRLAQLARATGIHLIVATQRPSVDVITGIIKANIPSRIAFAVSSQVDSRTILDMGGAERLLGRGDMLFLPIDAPKPKRSQGAYISGEEVNRLVEFWTKQNKRPENMLDVEFVPIEDDDRSKVNDPLCYDAAKFIIETQYASTAQLQSQFSVGHPRAVKIMKQLEEAKVVGPHEGTKPRRILIGLSELEIIGSRIGRDAQAELFAE
jgi:DNA segregation ATPase FtsK/SpoIIIE-like protein